MVDCVSDFGYIAYLSAFLVGISLVFSIRMIYLVVGFIFGSQIMEYLLQRDSERS